MSNHPAPTPERVALEQRKFTELGKAATELRDSIVAVQEGRERYNHPITRRELFLDSELLRVENLLVAALEQLHENLQHREDYLDLVEIEEKERKKAAKHEEYRNRVRWTNSDDEAPGETEETAAARTAHEDIAERTERARKLVGDLIPTETREGLAVRGRAYTTDSGDQIIWLDPNDESRSPWGHTPDDSKHTDEEKN